uniref:G-protein coupled receptors family 1 profile domain-containing protein n=1 Tax=Panagrolaimus sp. ES5 TaxID=591445 RepID=A0AC34GYI5_9BILA
MWLTMDIWMCTASIYNLVAISIDRYIAIIKPLNYPMLVTKFRARCIVAGVWIGSFIICSPSFLLASTDKSKPKDCTCTPANSGMAYIIFSASSSFYIPMIVVIFVYVRIYIAACAATKSVYSGMMQVTANANKNPKNILMQNPSALSRTENMPMLRVHRGSSVAMKNSSMNAQMDSARSKLSPRRHSEEEKSKGDNSPKRNQSPSRRSSGSAHGSVRDFSDEPLLPDTDTQTPTVYERKKGDFSHQLSTTSEPETRPRYLTGSNKQMEKIREQLSLELAENGHNNSFKKSSANSHSDSHLKRLDTSTVISNMGAKTMPNSFIGSESKSNSSNGKVHVNSKIHLHPNSVPVKKKSYGANMITKIMRRNPRKRAGCAYEKRLSLEIKAAKTVAIVTGCFICCWLGFSILYGFSLDSNEVVWSIAFWLGYLNSALNPVIYTVFNREFRTCFKRLLTCNHFLLSNQSTQQTMYNSYNSQMRPSNKTMGYSSVSAPPYYSRSSPPIVAPSQSSTNNE